MNASRKFSVSPQCPPNPVPFAPESTNVKHWLRPLALIIFFILPIPAMALDCKPQVSGQGTSNLGQGPAEVAARLSWSANANSQYGSKYRLWTKAGNKQPASCTKKGSFPKTHVCIYRADPCG